MRRIQNVLLRNNTHVPADANASDPGDSGWIDMGAALPLASIIVLGAGASDTVQIYVSNLETQPLAGDMQLALGSAISAAGATILGATYRWVRVQRATKGGTPAVVNADLYGVAND